MRSRGGLLVGLVCLGVAWMFATPPLQAPDESAHYVRAVGIADGQVLGPREPIDPEGRANLAAGSWHAEQQRWIDHDRRGAYVAASLSPPGAACANDLPNTAGCVEVSYSGDYLPTAYALPAVAVLSAHDFGAALWWMRAASLVPALLFLGLAVWFASRTGTWMVIGLLGALTPMVLSIAAVLNPSGLEIAAGLAFLTGLLDLTADPERFSPWLWSALGLAGVVTVLTWQLGAVFAALDLVVAGALMSPRARHAVLRSRSRAAVMTAAALLAAIVLFLVYGIASGSLHSTLTLSPLGANLNAGRHALGMTLRGAVGIFGRYDVALPGPMSELWWFAVVALLAVALWAGDLRQRAVLTGTLFVAIAFPWLFYGFAYRGSGFGLQGRYVLPALTVLPLASGYVIAAAGRSVRASVIVAPAVVCFAAFQLVSWWIAAHHWAGSTDALFSNASWRPVLGWAPWLVLACLGALATASVASPVGKARVHARPRHAGTSRQRPSRSR